MAASPCPPIAITFLDVCDDSFYFTEAETEEHFQEDGFRRMRGEAKTFWIQSNESKYLTLTTDENLTAQDLDSAARGRPECKFNIQDYRDNSLEARIGKSVMLYCNKDGKKMFVCCRNDRDVYPNPMTSPQDISGKDHEAMFYKIDISRDKSESTSTGRYKFESTKYKNKFLAFEKDKDNPSFLKLVLHHKEADEVDESCHLKCVSSL